MLKTSFKITITQRSVVISNYIKPRLQLYIHMKQKICLFTNTKIIYQVSMFNKLCFLFTKLIPFNVFL